MKPSFDISKNGHFTVWEKGAWSSRTSSGSSVLVSGIAGEKLQSVYQRSPVKFNEHYLFHAKVGNLMAGATVSMLSTSNKVSYTVKVELARIMSLTTTNEDGREVDYEDELLFQGEQLVDRPLSFNFDGIDLTDTVKLFCKAAIEKASTDKEHQELFWGLPMENTKPVQNESKLAESAHT